MLALCICAANHLLWKSEFFLMSRSYPLDNDVSTKIDGLQILSQDCTDGFPPLFKNI